jgi:N-acetylmuramoyl-L-alanine amidase
MILCFTFQLFADNAKTLKNTEVTMKICIDPGHGGTDPGAIGTDPFQLEEKEFNLSLALLLEEELESRGHWVVMTRKRDRSVSLHARASFSNRLGAEFFVSIHANAAGTPAAEGMEVFHFPDSVKGGRAASAVLNSITGAFPDHRNRGVKEANFAVLRLTAMTAILIECEFITNPNQLQFLADPQNQQELAVAIANGIDAINL